MNQTITHIPYRQKSKWGFSNLEKELLIPCEYDYVSVFDGETAIVSVDTRFSLIDKNGDEYFVEKYDRIESFKDGLAAVHKNGKMGFVNNLFEEVIPCIYTPTKIYNSFSDGLCRVKSNDKIGFIDTFGRVVIDYQFIDAHDFSNGVAAIRNGKSGSGQMFGLINKNGDQIIPYKYDWIHSFNDELAAVKINSFEGVIDKADNIIIPLTYQTIGEFSEGYIAVREYDGGFYYIDKLGNPLETIIKGETYIEEWTYAGSFQNGYAKVRDGENWGFVNKEGFNVIPCQYQSVDSFNEGLAAVKKNNLYSFINPDGKTIIQPNYLAVGGLFKNGIIKVRTSTTPKNQFDFIDSKGNEFFE
jgi:hypothetical protein